MAIERIKIRIISNRENDTIINRLKDYENLSNEAKQLLPVVYKSNIGADIDITGDDYSILQTIGLQMVKLEELGKENPRKAEMNVGQPKQVPKVQTTQVQGNDEKTQPEKLQETGNEEVPAVETDEEMSAIEADEEVSQTQEENSEEDQKFAPETEEEKQREDEAREEFEKEREPQIRKEMEEKGASKEEIDAKVCEEGKKVSGMGKHYYLTSETILENLKKINGGTFWNYLVTLGIAYHVERAYNGCVWPGQLNNPLFLNNAIKGYLPEGQAIDEVGLRNMHSMALASTFVGYKIEEVENTSGEKDDKSMVVAKFPETVDTMPQSLKNEVRDKVFENLKKIVQTTLQDNNKYTAICALVPMDSIFAKAMEETKREFNSKDPMGGKKIAIIEAMKPENGFRRELGSDEKGFDISFAVGDIDWQDSGARNKVISLLKIMSGNEETVNKDVLQDIDIMFFVGNSADVENLKNTTEQLKSLGAEVNVQYANVAPPEEKQKIDKEMAQAGLEAKKVPVQPNVEKNMARGATLLTAGIVAAEILSMEKDAEEIEEEPEEVQENRTIPTPEEDEKIEAAGIDYYAEQVNEGAYDKDYAVYLLAMDADVTPEVAEAELEEAILAAEEEKEDGFFSHTQESEDDSNN